MGHDVVRDGVAARRSIGVVPQEIALYEDLSARENLSYWGGAQGLRGAELRDRINDVLELTGLLDRAKEPIKQFSGGMKRRLNFACGIVHQPKVLLLDEPTVGVDPQSRVRLLELVRDQARARRLRPLHHALHGRSRDACATGWRSSITATSSRKARWRNCARCWPSAICCGSPASFDPTPCGKRWPIWMASRLCRPMRSQLSLSVTDASHRLPSHLRRDQRGRRSPRHHAHAAEPGKPVHQTHRQGTAGIAMRFVFTSAVKDLRRLRRDPVTLLTWLGIPTFIAVISGD